MGFTYEGIVWAKFRKEKNDQAGWKFLGELSQILFQLYDYMLQSPILEQLKIEEVNPFVCFGLTDDWPFKDAKSVEIHYGHK